MLAPIALYPDSLLAQILIAATYPDQVMEADSWLKKNPDLKGEPLNAALDKAGWDLSVKALAPFPQVLAMMARESAWTEKLGQAFLAQQPDVMDAVQKLRHKAMAAGNLKSTAEQKVVVKSEDEYVGGPGSEGGRGYGNESPGYGPEPGYGNEPPQYGNEPPPYGSQPPRYGNERGYESESRYEASIEAGMRAGSQPTTSRSNRLILNLSMFRATTR